MKFKLAAFRLMKCSASSNIQLQPTKFGNVLKLKSFRLAVCRLIKSSQT